MAVPDRFVHDLRNQLPLAEPDFYAQRVNKYHLFRHMLTYHYGQVKADTQEHCDYLPVAKPQDGLDAVRLSLTTIHVRHCQTPEKYDLCRIRKSRRGLRISLTTPPSVGRCECAGASRSARTRGCLHNFSRGNLSYLVLGHSPLGPGGHLEPLGGLGFTANKHTTPRVATSAATRNIMAIAVDMPSSETWLFIVQR